MNISRIVTSSRFILENLTEGENLVGKVISNEKGFKMGTLIFNRKKYPTLSIGIILLVFFRSVLGQDYIPPDSTDMRNITSIELAQEMIPGWNVGNSLEAIGGETAWGKPQITQRLIDAVKAAGFNAIRIPVAWSKFSDESTFTIEESWLERVEEVVCYVLSSGMYAIINEHWDNGWIQPTYADSAYVKIG